MVVHNIKAAITSLFKKLEKVAKEEQTLRKRRNVIEAKIRVVRSKCPHKKKKQLQGTFCFYCTECRKQM